MSIEKCIKTVEITLTGLESTTTQGFLTSFDLTSFPVVSEFLAAFIQYPEKSLYVTGDKSMESYK